MVHSLYEVVHNPALPRCHNHEDESQCRPACGYDPDNSRSQTCRSPCSGVECGKNAYCKVLSKSNEKHDSLVYCQCRGGYVRSTDSSGNLECIDLDECKSGKTCSQYCENLPGSFKCHCLREKFYYANLKKGSSKRRGYGYSYRDQYASCKFTKTNGFNYMLITNETHIIKMHNQGYKDSWKVEEVADISKLPRNVKDERTGRLRAERPMFLFQTKAGLDNRDKSISTDVKVSIKIHF